MLFTAVDAESLLSCSVVYDSLPPHGLQNADFPFLHHFPELAQTHVHLVGWCHPTVILYHPLLPLPSVFPNMRVFSNKSAPQIRWPKYWCFSFRIILPMNIQGWFPLGSIGLISLMSTGLSRVFSSIRVQKHQFFAAQLSL